ncbi:MAG: hypothetical protein WCA04_16455 [Geobacteraceae bacterium]
MSALFVKSTVIWIAFIPLAIINGLFREKFLVALCGNDSALALSGISCALLYILLAYAFLPWFGPLTLHQQILIGIFWLVMTVLFEFFFGHLVAHKPWNELLQAYNIFSGNLWILVLVTVATSPILAAKLRALRP